MSMRTWQGLKSRVAHFKPFSKDKYVAPELPFDLPSFEEYRHADFEFGKVARKKHFFLEDCTFLNHGAFGSVLRQALEVAQQWQCYIERQPLRFFDRELLPHLVDVTRRLAKFVGCDATDLILLPNVTTAVNCVLRSQNLHTGDKVLYLSTEYGAVKKIIRQVCEETSATVQEVILPLPMENKSQILKLVEESLQADTKLAVFDHIPSNTPFITPIQELANVCHANNTRVLIDGAHALGSLHLDLQGLGVDYYVSNCHKWFCGPKGSAFMYASKSHQGYTRPLVISHGWGSGFNSEFVWSGLRDYSPFLALHTVLDFWLTVGPSHLRDHMYSLAIKAANLLMDSWNTKPLASLDMCGSMLCIQLPSRLYQHCPEVNYGVAEVVQNALFHRFNIEVPIKAVQGKLYARISVHIYNTLEEYEALATAVLQLEQENILSTGHS